MSTRGVLSPLTNTPISSRRLPQTKYVSPSTGRQPGLSTSGSPTLSLLTETHDDEKERRDRRRSRILQLQQNHGTSPSASPSDRRGTALNGLTSSQLAEHYTNCIQLSAENKINSKNAFGLHLIDYMAELLKKKELENFQVASSTLDASAKIYAGRVDNIHSETYKVLSGLGTGGNKHEDHGQGDDGPGEEGDGEDDNKRKKRKTKSKIIRTNLNTINVNKFDLEFEVDPMFHVMSATFDEGGASGLLLNSLRCYDDRQLLVMDSAAVVPVVDDKTEETESQSQPEKDSVHVAEVKDLLEKMNLEEKNICPALSEFRLTGWDGSEKSSVFSKRLSEFAFDPHGEVDAASTAEDDLASLPGDLDPADLHDISDEDVDNADDGDMGDNSTDHVSGMKGDSQTAEFIHNAFNDLTQGNTGKLMQILASQPTDYSYFNKVLMRTWAGPSHWKTAPVSRDPSFRSLNSKSQKSKSKRPPFHLTYEKTNDLEGKFKASKATALTKATLQKYTKKKTTLPEDLHFQADKLFRLFHRQNIMIKRQETGEIGVEDGIQNYDYDNINDRENFCPALGGDDDDDDDGPDLGFNFSDESQGFGEASHSHMSQPSLACNDTSLTGDKLLSQPYKVAKIDISYAKMAKRVDVRKLKAAMWNLLTSHTLPAAPTQTPSGRSEEEERMMQAQWRFQSLLETLPTQVSSSMAKNLSVPIAFVCLLHLANEKTLTIFDQDMSDLTISQDL
ncbi:condensin complex subunit 2-like [Littorina saxatilis]|uniref:Condensin complex subunit 2 n=1 Tax=Littorina saxatilis TaxID=31220 RepID=A0AAN9GK09_9CAEN